MAGIYLHIPFCKSACNYCNFHFTTSLRYRSELVAALTKEIEIERQYTGEEKINTVYFGGGTPSLLKAEECENILNAIHRNFPLSPSAEITLEANPDDISVEKLETWKALGINRLSIGVQSFFDEELRWMNRAHTAHDAHHSLLLAKRFFDNITIDLIYGGPLLTDDMWKENVNTAVGLGIPHLSCYALTVEEKTPLFKSIQNKQIANVDQDTQARQFLLLREWMLMAGYEHYEVSNFCKPGWKSRHNSAYWKGETYLGLGPSAHSYNGAERRWNIANNNIYIAAMEKGDPAREKEMLTSTQRLNEYLMISLRTAEGLCLEKIDHEWGESVASTIESKLQEYINDGLALRNSDQVVLTATGMLRADGLAAELFF